MAIPQREFSADIGDKSTGLGSPDMIEKDLDKIFNMLNPDAINEDESVGGIGTENIQDNSITDPKIGERTIDQNIADSFSNTSTITKLLSFFAKIIKTITGKDNWYETPSDTIEGLHTRINTNDTRIHDDLQTHKEREDNPHNVTATQVNAYSKTEMQSSGLSQMHWDNIISKPSLASNKFKGAVNLNTDLPIIDNTLNDFYLVGNDGDGYPAMYICISTTGTITEQWGKVGDFNFTDNHSQLQNLNVDTHQQYYNLNGCRPLDANMNFSQHQAENLVDHKGTLFPINPVAGQRFFRTDTGKSYLYDGVDWKSVMGVGAVSRRGSFTASLTGIETFEIINGQYEPNTFTLLVFINGTLKAHNELDATHFSVDVATGDKVVYWLLENRPEIVGNYKLGKFKNRLTVSPSSNTVNIGIAEFIKNTDLLLVWQNGTYIEELVNYTIVDDSTLQKVSGDWADGTVLDLVVIKNVRVISTDDYFDGVMVKNLPRTSIDASFESDLSSLEMKTTSERTRKITFGTVDPTGGEDGDIYFQYDE